MNVIKQLIRERADSPKADALPGCATPRKIVSEMYCLISQHTKLLRS